MGGKGFGEEERRGKGSEGKWRMRMGRRRGIENDERDGLDEIR